MSFQLTHKLPDHCLVAVSGGIDSTVALHWLNQKAGRVRGVVHMNHNSGGHSEIAEGTVRDICERLSIPFYVRKLSRTPEPGHSTENWWREHRYRWFKEASALNACLPIVVAHNMNDCLEEYLMCTMVRGFSGTIPYAHGPCIRPFRLWKREDMESFARREKLTSIEDPSNGYTHKYKRAYIRHKILPLALELNPGLYKIVEKAIREQDRREE